ncbi:protein DETOXIFICATION 44, chloroplastic-like isoform X2 [Arachis stenosperma]|uniref:protein DETOXIFICATION 44, chloroplastic-like isoform X2 n=1 Tax=Arachis stenosperma TaxID=217475 RepID=UPI0025AB9A02|nr:protein DETOXIFICATION 44, chloroplastic-like isoform X2 [Arachis stenosperma]
MIPLKLAPLKMNLLAIRLLRMIPLLFFVDSGYLHVNGVLKFNIPALNRNGWLKFNELGKEILSITLPAALALAADPLTSLIDTAFVGHIDFGGKYQSKRRIPSVSTSLALAATLGIAETVLLSLGSGIIMNIMGIPADSPMRGPAENFLMLKAFGAPAIVIALAAQGTFRGFKDTKTPLYVVGVGNVLNAILDPILMFFFGLGISGAVAATVISEYLIAFILLWKLTGNVLLTPFHLDGRKIFSYLKSGGLLIGRTVAVFLTLTLSTSMAAKQGPIPMAGHQICMQVWLPISLVTDALALAGQTLLANSYSQGNYEQARLITYRVLQIGLGTGITLSMILFFGFGSFSSLFTTDLEVLSVARSGILFVAGTQPVNALAFVIDGLYYGVSDYGYVAYSMGCWLD